MSNDYFEHTNELNRHTLGRAENVNSIFDAVEAGFDKLPNPDALNQGRQNYVADTGVADAYVVALSKVPASYTAGLAFTMKASAANTGAATVNVNSLGVKPIKRYDGSDLDANDIVAGMLVHMAYDGTNFRIVGAHGASETNAAASASAAATSETNAASSASSASSSASSASTSASSASSSATAAGNAQTAAETAQSAAETAETNAETAETSAAASASAASTSETNAASSASAASTSESNAASSASAAATSESNAATSEANAAASFDAFDDRYLGSKSSDPATDNDGNALLTGALYFNTTTDTMRVYDGTTWADVGNSATLNTFVFTATGGETSLSGNDDDGNTLAYTAGFIQVYKNGALLVPTDDYTATNGTSITGLAALSASDVVQIEAFSPFEITDPADVLGIVADGAITPKNYILNGSFRFNQREAASVDAAGEYAVDRFNLNWFGGFSSSVSLSQESGSTLSDVGGSHLKIATSKVNSLSSTTRAIIRHHLMGLDVADLKLGSAEAKTVTLVFKTRANASCVISLSLRNSANDRSYVVPLNVSTGETEHEITVPLDTSGTWLADTGIGLRVEFAYAAGSSLVTSNAETWESGDFRAHTTQTNMLDSTSRYLEIADLRMFEGTEAYPMVLPPYSEELARCQEFYWRGKYPNVNGMVMLGAVISSGNGRGVIELPVTMRAAPSIAFSSDADFSSLSGGTYVDVSAAVGSNPNSIEVNIGMTGTTTGAAVFLRSNSADAWIEADADL